LTPGPDLPPEAVARFVFDAPRGRVVMLGGVDATRLRLALDAVEPEPAGRRALLARVTSDTSSERIVEGILDIFAEASRSLWPTWHNDIVFPLRDDALGRHALDIAAREAAKGIPGVSRSWLESAARLALAGRSPRVRAASAAIELGQLALTINRYGLVLVADVETPPDGADAAAWVHALEWVAAHLNGAVVALVAKLPPSTPPFDRILYGARAVASPREIEERIAAPSAWIAPWRGAPHPGSVAEQRLAAALAADPELAPLFVFNQFIETARGSRPRVDLVWNEGRLVVEIDGYALHGNRLAFAQDRHRDFELALSGYVVLRLTNDEIAEDMAKAVHKIREIAAFRRRALSGGKVTWR
jgi:hypothetical protein